MRRAAGLLLVLAAATGSARADTYPRQPGVDVLHYTFRLALADDSDRIEGEATVSARVADGTGEVFLDLAQPEAAPPGRGMTVTAVTEAGQPLSHDRSGDRLRIVLARPGRAGERREIVVSYHGVPAGGLLVGPNKHGDRTFFSDNWPNKARQWLPVVDHPYDKATAEFRVTAPAHYQVVSNGLLVEETDLGDGRRLSCWRQSVPIASWLYVLGVARFAVEHRPAWKGLPVETWVFPQDRDRGFEAFAEPTVAALDFFSTRVGPYSYERLANVQANGVKGGMEAATSILYGDDSVSGPRQRWDSVIVHEIAHQWFGNAVTESDWDDVWLSEGFATYFTHLFVEHAEGRDAFVAGLRADRDRDPRLRPREPRLPHRPRQPVRHEAGDDRGGHLSQGRLDAPHAARGGRRRGVLARHPRVLPPLPRQERLDRRLPPGDGGGVRERARLVLRPVAPPRRHAEGEGPVVLGRGDTRAAPRPRAAPGGRSLPDAGRRWRSRSRARPSAAPSGSSCASAASPSRSRSTASLAPSFSTRATSSSWTPTSTPSPRPRTRPRTGPPSSLAGRAHPCNSWGDAPPLHRGREGPPEQPEGRERPRADRRGHRGDRRGRGGQVLARLRRALRRGPPALRGDLLPLRPAVPRAPRPAPGRADRGRPPGGRGGPHRARPHLPLDGRHDDLGRRLPAGALRPRRDPPLPPVRAAGRSRLAVVHLRGPGRGRRGPERPRLLPAPGGEEGGDRRHPRGLREGGIPSGAGGRRGETDRGVAPAPRGRRDHGRARPRRGRARAAPADRGLARDGAPPRGGEGRAPGRGRGAPPPVERGPPLRDLRPRLRRSDPRSLLVQPPGGRLRDLQGLRPHDGDRPRPGDPGRPQVDPPGLREALPDQLLQRLPGRPRALLPARGAARRRAVRGPAGGGAAPRLGGRAGRPPEPGRRSGTASTASSSGSSRARTGCTCASSSPATAATARAPTAAGRGSRPRPGSSGSPGARSPRSRPCRWPRRSARSASGASPARTPPPSSSCTRSAAGCASSWTWASAT